eukprot:scaffold78762_cov72-Phaeocystis_antarctica.AAC.2
MAVLTVAVLTVAILAVEILAALRRRRACLSLLTRAVLTILCLLCLYLLYYLAAQAGLPQVYAWERSNALEVNTVRWAPYLLCYSTCLTLTLTLTYHLPQRSTPCQGGALLTMLLATYYVPPTRAPHRSQVGAADNARPNPNPNPNPNPRWVRQIAQDLTLTPTLTLT